MVTNFQPWKRLVEQEQQGKPKSTYGSYLLKNLSRELSDEFGTGFSVAKLLKKHNIILIMMYKCYCTVLMY